MDKWEIERQKERAQIADDQARLERIIKQWTGWTIERMPEPDAYRACVEARNGEKRLFIQINKYNQKGKISISGTYPKDAEGNFASMYNTDAPSEINISVNKTDETIIRDIEKRFLPEYNKALEAILERVKNTLIAQSKRGALMKKLAKVLDVTWKAPERSANYKIREWLGSDENNKIQSYEFESRYNADQVKIELEVNPETAEEIARIIKKYL